MARTRFDGLVVVLVAAAIAITAAILAITIHDYRLFFQQLQHFALRLARAVRLATRPTIYQSAEVRNHGNQRRTCKTPSQEHNMCMH